MSGASEGSVYRVIFGGLVKDLGGVDAAAAVLEARYGAGNKGTISKMNKGSMAVTIEAMMALEDAVERYPCTEYLADRIGRRDGKAADFMELAADVSRESGEAVGSVLSAFSSKSKDPENMTEMERARALKEVGELVTAGQALFQKISRIHNG